MREGSKKVNGEKEKKEKKILAVIPARAGSKGIPNKNIRIVEGHPLIYYSIRNALDSRYITDVVVTTDSQAVEIAASQMGVGIRHRGESLSTDDVTLDAVIHDAVPADREWDYIVTMQPTSPTLLVSTLDKAIEYAMAGDYDTVISAINDPHLSWTVKDGRTVPNYEKRLNRQYLPPCYVETGAFVISKASVVTPETRIGEKVSVYEVSRREAVDIDSFADLRCAELYLSEPKVAIYVNGNNSRGVGHIYRALELADEFFVKPDIYYDVNQTDISLFGRTTHFLIPVNGISDLFRRCRKEQYTIFINDILSTGIDYMIALRNALPNAKIINFEDDGEGMRLADLGFNALYEKSEYQHVYSGEKYYIAGKSFLFYEPIPIRDKVRRMFISFGGADPQNYSDRLLAMISKEEYKDYEFTVVLGRAKANTKELLQYNDRPNIEVFYDVANMPELMSKCDVAVTSRGRTGYELALLGIPSIAMAQNEREEKHGFVSNENGFSYIGLNPGDDVIESTVRMYLGLSKESRQRYQTMLLAHKLKDGRRRIMSLIGV